MIFEWDPAKAKVNHRKHGVTFEEAASTFFDPNGFEVQDVHHSDDEQRWIRIAISAFSRLLLVVHTEREKHGQETSASSAHAKRVKKKNEPTLVSFDANEIMSRLRVVYEKEKESIDKVDNADEHIDFSDVPELTEDQLRSAKRTRRGRPPLGAFPRKTISMKIDPGVLEQIKLAAEANGTGYQTFIHGILEDYLKKNRAA